MSSKLPEAQPDYWREQLNTLAQRRGLTCVCEVEDDEGDDKTPFFSAAYYLTHPKREYLGSSAGTSKTIAKEWAALQAVGRLVSLIDDWTHNTTVSVAALTNTDMNTYGSLPIASVDHWTRQLITLTNNHNLQVVYRENSSAPPMVYATYFLQYDQDSIYQIGSGFGTSLEVARADAAHRAVETLTIWIEIWKNAPTNSSVASG